ncbi:MAG: KOW domain-containing RNA-binding protein [Alicyclobacillaceae bacterium]|nr:KOW domain-containing RNA-binding protein [Alicyclobacillaceae bacterium]
MARVYRPPDVGDIVEVRQGRETGRFMVVIGRLDDRYVWLADGDRRTVERPKKKNVLHVRPTGKKAEVVVERLHTMGRVTDADLRFSIRRFLRDEAGNAEH